MNFIIASSKENLKIIKCCSKEISLNCTVDAQSLEIQGWGVLGVLTNFF